VLHRVERPPAAGVGQPLVAGSAQQHDAGFAGGSGDRGGSGIAAPAGSIEEAGRIVSELAQHPAAKDHADSGQTTQDLGVRVVSKRAANAVSSSAIAV
jgi:hypothetical protein